MKYTQAIGLRSRNQAEKELRKEQILAAAIIEFGKNGYENTTMSAIARRSGLSRTLVNFYFRNKAGVHGAIERQALKKLTDMFEEAFTSFAGGMDKIQGIAQAYLAFHQQYPGFSAALMRSEENGTGLEALPVLKKLTHNVMDVICRAIQSGIQDGTVKHAFKSDMQGAVTLWAIVQGCLALSDNKTSVIEQHLELKKDAIFEGLQTVIQKSFGA